MSKDSPSAQDRETAAKIREWMLRVLDDKDWRPARWAKEAGLAPSTVQRAVKEDYEFVTSSRTLTKLAEAAGTPLPDFGSPKSEGGGGMIELPVRHDVAASAFHARDELAQDPIGWAEVHRVKPFRDFHQWLERVIGDSMNEIYPPGTILHVVDAIQLGYAPRHDDAVIVERTRAGGAMVERTVKQVALTPNGVELWPRSHNKRWNAPISLTAGANFGEDIEVRIVGLVVRGYIGLPVSPFRHGETLEPEYLTVGEGAAKQA